MSNLVTPVDSGLEKVQSSPSIETNLVRNLSTVVDKDNEISHYYVVCKAKEILKLSTADNLRDYYGEKGSGSESKSNNAVHAEILNTFKHTPALFKILHSGFTIVASSAKENVSRTLMHFNNAELINGAQSQGVVKDLIMSMINDGDDNSVYHNTLISLEVICTSDVGLRDDICNARNNQTQVMLQSRLQLRGVFRDLNINMIKAFPELTNDNGDVVDGRETNVSPVPPSKLIQITRLFLPNDLMDESKVKKSYVGVATNLNNFSDWFEGKSGDYKEIYSFMVDFAPIAWEQYLKWNSHPAWSGNHLKDDEKAIGTKLPDGNWTDIKQGVLFPILRALYCFVQWDGKKASFDSSKLDEAGLIREAIRYYRDVANRDPQTMGKDIASYQSLAAFARGIDIRV